MVLIVVAEIFFSSKSAKISDRQDPKIRSTFFSAAALKTDRLHSPFVGSSHHKDTGNTEHDISSSELAILVMLFMRSNKLFPILPAIHARPFSIEFQVQGASDDPARTSLLSVERA